MKRGILCGVLLTLLGCASEPASRAPGYDPPPAEERRLGRDEVVAEGKRAPSEEAIAFLDRHPFDFDLEAQLPWLEGQELPPEVLDYLRKRSLVDWEGLRGDVDPDRGRDFGGQSR